MPLICVCKVRKQSSKPNHCKIKSIVFINYSLNNCTIFKELKICSVKSLHGIITMSRPKLVREVKK